MNVKHYCPSSAHRCSRKSPSSAQLGPVIQSSKTGFVLRFACVTATCIGWDAAKGLQRFCEIPAPIRRHTHKIVVNGTWLLRVNAVHVLPQLRGLVSQVQSSQGLLSMPFRLIRLPIQPSRAKASHRFSDAIYLHTWILNIGILGKILAMSLCESSCYFSTNFSLRGTLAGKFSEHLGSFKGQQPRKVCFSALLTIVGTCCGVVVVCLCCRYCC